jgi:hypothetical protein
MKPLHSLVCLCTLLLGPTSSLFAQRFENNSGEREKHFVYQVKQIDEFFERFNDDPNSFIRDVYKDYKVAFKLDRNKLIRSLFNYESKNWNQVQIDAFIERALKVEMPSGKDWYGENWFAEANCRFQYNTLEIDIPVILKIITDEQKRSKWVIAGVKASALKEPEYADVPIKVRTRKLKFINPASHGTKFIELERSFNDKENLSDYFENAFFYRRNALSFFNAVKNERIKFRYVNDIKYHFLNVDKYIFTVEYFQRESLNSGWLINNLRIASASEKESFKKLLLGD